MVLNPEPHCVELVYAGQNVAVTETVTSFENERQKVEISLVKSIEQNEHFGIGTNGEMKNISFGLFAAEEIVSASGTSIPANGLARACHRQSLYAVRYQVSRYLLVCRSGYSGGENRCQ